MQKSDFFSGLISKVIRIEYLSIGEFVEVKTETFIDPSEGDVISVSINKRETVLVKVRKVEGNTVVCDRVRFSSVRANMISQGKLSEPTPVSGASKPISVKAGLDILRDYGKNAKYIHLEMRDGSYRDFDGGAVIEQVRVPRFAAVDENNPDHWEIKKVLYPLGAKDGDTTAAVLVENLTRCMAGNDALIFDFEEDNPEQGVKGWFILRF